MKAARLLVFTLVAVATLFGASRSDAQYEDGKWIGDVECTLYQYTLTNAFGQVTQVWYQYEDCVPVDYAGMPDWLKRLFDRAPKDPFEGCKDTCDSPCRIFTNGCHFACTSIQSCLSCCDSWRDTANKARGCQAACQELNREAWEVCKGDCGQI